MDGEGYYSGRSHGETTEKLPATAIVDERHVVSAAPVEVAARWIARINFKSSRSKCTKSTSFALSTTKIKRDSQKRKRNSDPDNEWKGIPESEYIKHNGTEYLVGEMITVEVLDEQLGTRLETAVIAECREPYVLVVWLYEVDKRKELFADSGIDTVGGCKLVLSTNADVVPKSTLKITDEVKRVYTEAVLHFSPQEQVIKLQGTGDCYMRKLAEKVRAGGEDLSVASTISSNPSPHPGNDVVPEVSVKTRDLSLSVTKLPEPTKNMKDNHDFAAGTKVLVRALPKR